MQYLDEAANGSELDLSPGAEFELCLVENRTTGYTWQFRKDGSSICKLLEDRYEPGSGPPGSAGRHRWRFRVVEAGRATLALAYQRSWEQAPAQSFTLALHAGEIGG